MEFTTSAIVIIALIAMLVSTLLAIIPYLPGPILVWGVALVAAFATSFQRITIPAVIIMSAFMLIGTLQQFWLPLFGVNSKGLSCLGAVGSIIGGVIGTFLIPIPILGTILGSIIGALVVEFTRFQEAGHALRAGKTVFMLYVWGKVVELAFCIGIIAVFIVSAWSTA